MKIPKQEKYNLQRLLEVRERMREAAVKFLAENRRQLSAAEAELERRRKAVEDCRKEQQRAETTMWEKAKGGVKASEIVVHRQHLMDLREKEAELLTVVEQQKTTVACAAEEVEKALAALAEATKEMQVIEKHRENWQRGKRVEQARREQKINDEIGAILHERQKGE